MTTMDRLADLLGDVDELLDQADAQTITESLDRGEAPDHLDVDHTCPWCGHGFHGLPCAPPPDYGPARSSDVFAEIDTYAEFLTGPSRDWSCRCDSALLRQDDTWRPVLTGANERDLRLTMDETGMDGWAAHVELPRRRLEQAEQRVRERQLAHERQRRETRNRIICRHMDETGLDGWAAIADRRRPIDLAAVQTVFTQVFTQVGDVLQAVAGAVRDVRVSVGQLMANGVPPLAEWQRALVEGPEPSIQERALQLRRHRNTGPEQPTAGRARRPRRHGG